MRLQRLSGTLNVITVNPETHLLTSLSLQAEFSCKLFELYFYNFYIDQFKHLYRCKTPSGDGLWPNTGILPGDLIYD